MQDREIHNRLLGETLSPVQGRKYKKLKEEIIVEVKSLRLNRACIRALVEQLYDVNRRLMSCESRLIRLTASYDVAREDFLQNYNGSAPLGAGRASRSRNEAHQQHSIGNQCARQRHWPRDR